jgi:hypothetical protein
MRPGVGGCCCKAHLLLLLQLLQRSAGCGQERGKGCVRMLGWQGTWWDVALCACWHEEQRPARVVLAVGVARLDVVGVQALHEKERQSVCG